MEEKRVVSQDRVDAFKHEKGIHFHFETSAKTGENIESLFITASKILYHNFKDKIAQMVSAKSKNFYFTFYWILIERWSVKKTKGQKIKKIT